jgi:hypothetical protein
MRWLLLAAAATAGALFVANNAHAADRGLAPTAWSSSIQA